MVELNNRIKARVSGKWVSKVLGDTLRFMGKKGDVSVALVGDAEIKRLNKKFRQKDEATDVLSFSNLEGEKMRVPGDDQYLGEVIIGYGQVKRQAQERNHSIKRELLILLIHGVLHLLRYEHEGGGSEGARMRKKEGELLKNMG